MKEQLAHVYRRRQISQLVKHYGIHPGNPPAFSRDLFLLKLIDRVYRTFAPDRTALETIATARCVFRLTAPPVKRRLDRP
jgi:hypothetical protein